MNELRAHSIEQLELLKSAVENAEESLRQTQRHIAELEARLTWSHSRQVQELAETPTPATQFASSGAKEHPSA